MPLVRLIKSLFHHIFFHNDYESITYSHSVFYSFYFIGIGNLNVHGILKLHLACSVYIVHDGMGGLEKRTNCDRAKGKSIGMRYSEYGDPYSKSKSITM